MTKIHADEFDPELCNCAVARRAGRFLSRFYDAALAPIGLKATQYTLLGQLKRRGPMVMMDLAQVMAMDRATIGHNLRPLERDGLVAIRVHEADRRARMVSVTAKGTAAVERGHAAWNQAQKTFEAQYGEGQAVTMRKLISRVVAVDLSSPRSA